MSSLCAAARAVSMWHAPSQHGRGVSVRHLGRAHERRGCESRACALRMCDQPAWLIAGVGGAQSLGRACENPRLLGQYGCLRRRARQRARLAASRACLCAAFG